ncbi:MAG: DUF3450 family protein [Victivallales bacterium]|nr:DUF3450 family protein [Victivallales bacterium]
MRTLPPFHLLARLWVLLLLLACRAPADPPAVRRGLETLEDLVGQLIQVQKAAHAAKTEWQDQEAQLKREDELLRRRISQANEKLKAITAEAAEAHAKRTQATGAAQATEAALARHFAPIVAAEQRLSVLRRRLPPLLAEALAKEFDKLPAEATPMTQDNVADRLRLVLSLTTEIEQYDAAIHAGAVVLSPPDKAPREMAVLQLGLGIAFAVATDRSCAAVGEAGEDHWQWRWQDELAEPIAIALEVFRKKRPAQFVNLPLQLGRTAP